MEKAKSIISFADEEGNVTLGILFENGWCLCLCCGGWQEPGEYTVVHDYGEFTNLDLILKGAFE